MSSERVATTPATPAGSEPARPASHDLEGALTGVGGFLVPDPRLMRVLREMRALRASDAPALASSTSALRGEPTTLAKGATS